MCSCRCGIVVVVELLGSMHGWVCVGADMLLLSIYCCGNKEACVIVCVELLLSLS